jgi:transcriptional regulator with XRE-family HTH domain
MAAQDRAALQLLGARLRRERLAKGWGLRAFATHAEIDQAFLSRLERGLENVSILTLLRMTRALTIHLRDLTRDI